MGDYLKKRARGHSLVTSSPKGFGEGLQYPDSERTKAKLYIVYSSVGKEERKG